jgi:hypothetical protein
MSYSSKWKSVSNPPPAERREANQLRYDVPMTTTAVIGHQKNWTEFACRNKAFTAYLPRLNELIGLTFLRQLMAAGFLDKVVFFLGNEAVEEFGRVLALVGNGVW